MSIATALLCAQALAAVLSITDDGVGNIASQTDARGYTLEHAYAPMDQRLWKAVALTAPAPNAGTRTHYLYAAQGLIAEADASESTGSNAGKAAGTLHYGWEPNTENGSAPLYVKRGNGTLPSTNAAASTITWLHYDDLGTPVKGTNGAGQLVWTAGYDAAAQFGATLISYPQANGQGQGQPGTAGYVPTINLRAPGQYFDAETNLHYNDRRYYDPATARYLSRDPIRETDPNQSLYGYALHNPVNVTDPTGEIPIVPILVGIGKCALQCAAFAALTNPCDPDFSDCGLPCLLRWNWAGPKFKRPKPKGPKPPPNPCLKNSFTSETLVHAIATDGNTVLKPIEQIKVGDLVASVAEWTTDANAKPQTSAHPVTDIITSLKHQTIVTITLISGEQIKATRSHPFLTPDGWRAAQLLQAGGQLDLKGRSNTESDDETTHESATIASVTTATTTVRVYNLEVADTHTFLVGEQGVIVHNGRGRSSPGVGGLGGTGKGGSASSGGGTSGASAGGSSRAGEMGPSGGPKGGPYGRNPPPPLKDDVYRRDKGKCVYCGNPVQRKTPFRSDSCEFNHVTPWSRGGETSLENLATSCMPCNRSKGAKPLPDWGGR